MILRLLCNYVFNHEIGIVSIKRTGPWSNVFVHRHDLCETNYGTVQIRSGIRVSAR